MPGTTEQVSTTQPVETPITMPTDTKQAAMAAKPTMVQQVLGNSFVQGAIAGTVIAVLLYPAEYKRVLAQTATTLEENPSMWTHIMGVVKAIQGAQAKNFAIGQRETIAKAIPGHTHPTNQGHHEALETESHESNSKHNVAASKGNLMRTATVCTTVGALDTAMTTYFSNGRVHHALKIEPALPGITRKLAYGVQGAPIRFMRNTAAAMGLIAVHGAVNKQLQEKAGLPDSPTTLLLSSVIAGPVTAAVTTPLDVVNKNQIRGMTGVTNPTESLKTPSMWSTAKSIAVKHGAAGFFRGAGNAAVATTAASVAIEGVGYVCKKFAGPTA
jgi:spore maturation protein SpmB